MGALGMTILTGWLVSVFVNNCFLGRYAFPGFGFLMLFYAVGMNRLKSKSLRGAILAAVLVCFGLQYASECRLEYDSGLKKYEEFHSEQVTDEDVFISPTIHPLMVSIYYPEMQYYVYQYKPYKLPFANTEALMDYAQLHDVEGNIWYICFDGDTPEKLQDVFSYEEAERFHHMYYDYVIYRLNWK